MQKPAAPEPRFLSRWARRKAAAADVEPAVDSAPPADAAPVAAGESAPPALTDADMPPVDSLDADSDFSGFLSPGVSEALRKRALRKLFSSAIFNARDGLDDYDDDFRHFPALGDHITSDMKHRMEMEAERAKAEAEAAESPESPGEASENGEEGDADSDSPAADELPESPQSPPHESPKPPAPDR